MYPDLDFFDALVMLHTNPLTGEYLGVIAFGCGTKEFIYTGNGMLADVDRAAECFPYCVVDGSVSEASAGTVRRRVCGRALLERGGIMTPEDAMAEAWREVDTMMLRFDELERLLSLQRERNYYDDGQPTRYNPLDFENEIADTRAAFNIAAIRVHAFAEEARLGLIERGDLPDV